MKLKCWMINTLAIIIGSVFFIKRFGDNRKELINLTNNDNNKKNNDSLVITDSEVDDIDLIGC